MDTTSSCSYRCYCPPLPAAPSTPLHGVPSPRLGRFVRSQRTYQRQRVGHVINGLTNGYGGIGVRASFGLDGMFEAAWRDGFNPSPSPWPSRRLLQLDTTWSSHDSWVGVSNGTCVGGGLYGDCLLTTMVGTLSAVAWIGSRPPIQHRPFRWGLCRRWPG